MKPHSPARVLARVLSVAICLAPCIARAVSPKAWFRADSLSQAEGSAVTLWADSSRNANAAQSGSAAPTLSSSAMNGFPAVTFSGSQSMVFPRSVQDDFTMVVLFKAAAGAGNSDNFYAGAALVSGERPGAVDDFGMSLKDSGRVLMGVGNPDTTIRSTGGLANNSPHIATFTRVRSTGVIKNFVDRNLEATATAGGRQALSIYPYLSIGSHPGPTGPFLNGSISEILVYDSALDDAAVQSVENALRGKYALPNGTAPLAVEGLGASGNLVSWNEAPGARSYQLFRATTAGGPYSLLVENLTTAEYRDQSAPAGGTHYYKVAAVNAIGTSALSDPVESTTLALPANGPVVINEIHYNGLNNSIHSDFIELFNFSQSPADISGWRLSSAVDYVFPAGTVIPAGGYLVIAEDPSVTLALWGKSALGPYEKSLSSDGETIRLRNASNTIVHEVTYGNAFPWPCAPNGEGASMELVNPTLDATKGSSWRASVTPTIELSSEVASPGEQNLQFRLNPAPNIEDVVHSPSQPTSGVETTVTARLSDPSGISVARLSYQIVLPGSYIPAYLPLPIVNRRIDTSQPRPANPAFEDPANWTTVDMKDDGTGGDAIAGDGVYTAKIPARSHRTLVRYRVTAIDNTAVEALAPFADDMSKNFAYYVYDGVPSYQGVPSSTLTKLPVYQFLCRKADYDQCVAYNTADQLIGNTPDWTFENWGATMVFDGKVYDHIKFRLHGGNGRYYHTGKRGFRFFFNDGYHFQNRDQNGVPSPTKWKSITTENCWENRGTLTYCLNEMINFHLWNTIGIPAPISNWGHFRTVTTAAEQPDQYHGDFWGLIMIHEDYNGDFLDAHAMEKGNLYKLTRDATDGASQQRYQAPAAVADGSDHQNIYANLTSNKGEAYIRRYVDIRQWSYYHALCHAVRHYDYWPTGDNNGAYYFAPDYTDQTDRLGKLWVLPNDVDATWGPTWNEGKDRVWSAIFDAPANTGIYPDYFNAIREVRNLLWQQDQINPLLDEFAAVIDPFIQADSLRWKGGPNEAGNYNGLAGAGATSLAALVADMKQFAWTGGNWPGGSVGAGGTAALMDTLQRGVSNSESTRIPGTPVITYQGPAGYPGDKLAFSTSAFTDPQGVNTFSAIQWRVAEITNPAAPAYQATDKVKLEWTASYDSGPLATFGQTFNFPATACKPGHAYRARVRHRDDTGRWSHWSQPVAFIAGEVTGTPKIVCSEFLYRPAPLTPAETAAGFTDRDQFEYVEIRNVGTAPADVSGYNFNKGITFTFASGTVLAPGASTLVVQVPAAFNFRFGTGRPIAGTYSGKLANEGERVLLSNSAGETVFDFTYGVAAPWPAEALSAGRSLVLIQPETAPDPNNPANWRASTRAGGAPGYNDTANYLEWAAARGMSGAQAEDDDNDGMSNVLEYALVGRNGEFTPPPQGGTEVLNVSGTSSPYLTLSFRKQLDANDITYQVQHSTDFSSWLATPVLMGTTDHFDGTVTETWRAAEPTHGKGFLRVRVAPVP